MASVGEQSHCDRFFGLVRASPSTSSLGGEDPHLRALYKRCLPTLIFHSFPMAFHIDVFPNGAPSGHKPVPAYVPVGPIGRHSPFEALVTPASAHRISSSCGWRESECDFLIGYSAFLVATRTMANAAIRAL